MQLAEAAPHDAAHWQPAAARLPESQVASSLQREAGINHQLEQSSERVLQKLKVVFGTNASQRV